jgi:4-amino-4-deoxy-L-arabinose transferase-like glycosyltransferase
MRRAVLLGLFAVVLSVLVTPFGRELFVGDETKYSQVVREMRATHVFFLPTLGGTPFTHKPPVHFWFLDLLSFVFGTYSIWTYVLPSLVAFGVLLWLMWRIGGPTAAFICGTSLMVWASAQTARMDVSFTACLVAGAWLLYRFFERDDFRALLLSALALALATLIKGPMAPVIALLLFALEGARRRRVPRGNYLPAVAALIVIPLLWVVPAIIIGGQSYAREILVKQTVGRAISTWTHKAGPWFYVVRAPATLFPWFALALVAAIALWRRGDRPRFLLNWIAAVVVPYSLMSSKLDVYMMAMIPPVALLVADFVADAGERDARRGRIANLMTLALLALTAIAALFISPQRIKGPEAALAADPSVKMMFVVLAVASAIAILVSLRASLAASTIATGLAPICALVYAGIALMPLVNQLSSSRPLIDALERQHVAATEIALYQCPHLWSRYDFPRELEGVRYADADALRGARPELIATSRAHANEIAYALRGYRKVDELRMIGKWFDVYRR